MAEDQTKVRIEKAKHLMDSFAERTGIRTGNQKSRERYLWTDAFAVQTFFGLSHIFEDATYRKDAFNLIELVHENLGKFHPDDGRKGWISGLSDEEGKNYPTAGGLRIGKKLPEREQGEIFDERLEWERDGQYFHYHTRWIFSLLLAARESGDKKYAFWAADLLKAGNRFIYSSGIGYRMYWKMSTDLSRPLVTGMGGHDPLEGLICSLSIKEQISEEESGIATVKHKFKELCSNKSWSTSDSLGIGGLLFNTLKAAGFPEPQELPPSAKPERLLQESIISLEDYVSVKETSYPAHRRLAFRECGLSLGLRSYQGNKEKLISKNPTFEQLDNYVFLAKEVEDFWLQPDHQKASTWTEHENINAVSLAASLVASKHPEAYILF